jgi:membrane protease YdiL (CAAX protease family)
MSLSEDTVVAVRIAKAQFVDLWRRNTSTRREKALVAVLILLILPFALTVFRQAYAVGTITRNGVDAQVVEVTRNLLGPSMLIIAIFGGLGAAQSLARDSVRPLLLTSAPTRAIVLGKVLHLLVTWVVPLLFSLVTVTAYAAGARAPLFVVAVVVALLPVLALTMVVGMSLGYLLWVGVNRLGLPERLQRLLTASLSVVVFVGAFTLGISLGRTSAESSPAQQLPSGDPATPLGWYADLFFVGSPMAEPIGPRSVLAAVFVLGAIPAAFAALVRLAPAYWYATPWRSDDADEPADGSMPTFDRTPSELIGRTGGSVRSRSATLRATFGYLRDAYRRPDQFVYLFYYLFPVVGGLVSLAVDAPDALPQAVGVALIVLGVWLAGGVFCLNPIGSEGTMLTQLVLAKRPASTFVHARLLAGTAAGLLLAVPGAVLFSLTAGFVSPLAAILGSGLVAVVVVASAALALGVGSVLPTFETVEVFDSVETLAPSRLAGLIHAGLSAALLAGGAATTVALVNPGALSLPARAAVVVGFAVAAGVLADGSRRYAIARIRDHGRTTVRTDRPFALYAALGLSVLALVVGQLVSLSAILVLGIDLRIELLLPVLFVVEYGGYALVALGFLYVTHRGLGYLDLAAPSRRDLGYVLLGLLGSLAIWALGLTAITELGLPAADHALFEPGEDGEAILLLALVPLVLLVNGPVEELLYRNVIQKYLAERFPPGGAIVIASALFALIHLPAYATAAPKAIGVTLGLLFVISCLWGAIYHRTERLFVPAAIHGLYNATLLAGLYLTTV